MREGRPRAYLGATASLQIADGIALGDHLVDEIAIGDAADAGALLRTVRRRIGREGDAAAARALATLRLVGDPATALPAARILVP